ncbi:MAG: MarR family transcriptional regulator [Rhodothermia bacterium]|nr:MAG: MarR family transcriptional regulator [Rhodothermia bacterium]
MLREIGNKLKQAAEEALIDACWRQWIVLGASGTEIHKRQATSIVDVEQLILFSSLLRRKEQRLELFLNWFAVVGAPLVSLQRIQGLTDRFAAEEKSQIALFAQMALSAGDRRWKTIAKSDAEIPGSPKLKGPSIPNLLHPGALMLRFRAGFGLGAKADLMTILVGQCGHPRTVKHLVEAAAYRETSVREALRDLTLAAFVVKSNNRPAEYIARSPWHTDTTSVRETSGSFYSEGNAELSRSSWKTLWPVLSFLHDCMTLFDTTDSEELSEYIFYSKFRDVLETYRDDLVLLGIVLPHTVPTNSDFSDVWTKIMHQSVDAVTDWLAENL